MCFKDSEVSLASQNVVVPPVVYNRVIGENMIEYFDRRKSIIIFVSGKFSGIGAVAKNRQTVLSIGYG